MEKNLTLQIDRACFTAIAKGEQTEEHRFVYPKNATRYIRFKDEDGAVYTKEAQVGEGKKFDIVPVEYDNLILINGRRKDAPRLKVEVKSAEFVILTDEEGNTHTFEENGEEYAVCQVWYHLGAVREIRNAEGVL